jgi:hypothetical protein
LVKGKKSTLETWKAKISKKYQSHLQLLDTEMQDAKERLEKEYAEKKAFLVTRYSKALSNLDDFHADTCEILDGFDEWEKNVKSVVEEKNSFPLLEKKKALEVSLAGLVKRGTELDPFAIKGIPYLKTVPSAVEGPLLSFGRSCSYSQPHECQVSFPKRPCRVYCRRN